MVQHPFLHRDVVVPSCQAWAGSRVVRSASDGMLTFMRRYKDIEAWLVARGGIGLREDLLRAGAPLAVARAFVRDGCGELVRRAWIRLPSADDELVIAARAGGRLSCTTLARRRKWWLPEGVDKRIHLHLHPRAGATLLGPEWDGVRHWTVPVAPSPGRTLEATVEDALGHIAVCRPYEDALVLWESAARVERLSPEYLRTVRWTTGAARRLAHAVTGLADSGLETLLVEPLRRCGLRITQQAKVAGRFVDVLVGDRLVLQIDGFEFHSSSAQRTKDIAHDAELQLRGYTVMRFSYAQIVHEWPHVQRVILRAVAAGLDRAA